MDGSRIAASRRMKGLTQAELARAIGTSQAAIHRYESGGRDPRSKTVVELSMALGVPVTYLLGVSEDQNEPVGREAVALTEHAGTSIDDVMGRLLADVERTGGVEGGKESFMRIAEAMAQSDGDFLGFVNRMHMLLRASVGSPAIMARSLELASAVASSMHDGWDPIDRSVSPFESKSYMVPVVGTVCDEGTVWDERYKEKVLANARPVFPGTTDARNPDVR